MDTCAECGFTYDLDEAPGASAAIARGVSELASMLGAATAPTARPDEATWSPLEYACHVRDVLLVQRERVLQARRETMPAFAPMGRDERVDHDGYAAQDPVAVERQLREASLLFANVLDRLLPADWDRTVIYNYPKPWERSLRWVAVHTVHEVRHHLLDVRRQLEPAS